MQTAPRHPASSELELSLPDVIASPPGAGRLEAIFIRPAEGERRALATVQLTPEHGVEGDRWFTSPWKRLADGRPDPRNQVSLMNARFLRQLAVSENAMCLAGDNLIVDLDLSEETLPAHSRVRIGDKVVLEISELPHTGCAKLEKRYGKEAKAFINSARGKALHLRGRYAKVLAGGTISVGDTVRRLPAECIAGDSHPQQQIL